jgi:hypothetical protein
MGGMIGRPVVKEAVTSRLYPAHVEIAVEGVIPPKNERVSARWRDLGLAGEPPALWVREDQ